MSDNLPPPRELLSSSLVPPEIKPENGLTASAGEASRDPPLTEQFRHSGWRRNRDLVYRSLRRTMQTPSRIMAYAGCGDTAFVYKSKQPPHEYRLGGSGCRDRFCVPCARDRAHCLAANVLKVLKHKPSRFVTLTLAQSGLSLTEYLDKLYSAFSRLRGRRFWNNHVTGGCGFLELKWIRDTGDWNVHLHCIVHGSYMPQRYLSQEWHKATGDSYVADIRFVKDDDRIARYVVKYVSKPYNDTFIARGECLDEVVTATKGRRLCLTFGDWRGIKLTESPNDKDWVSIGEFHDVVERAVNGDTECIEAVRAICKDNANDIMDAAKRARPPPQRPKPPNAQLTFVWPPIDPTF